MDGIYIARAGDMLGILRECVDALEQAHETLTLGEDPELVYDSLCDVPLHVGTTMSLESAFEDGNLNNIRAAVYVAYRAAKADLYRATVGGE